MSLFPTAKRKTTSHFNFLESDRPSLCGCCGDPVGPLLVEVDGKWFGACSMEHQEQIKKGNRSPKVAQVSLAGVLHAKSKLKERYKEFSVKNKSWAFRDWSEDDRVSFFESYTREYLQHANERARNGVDGSYEIQDKTRTE